MYKYYHYYCCCSCSQVPGLLSTFFFFFWFYSRFTSVHFISFRFVYCFRFSLPIFIRFRFVWHAVHARQPLIYIFISSQFFPIHFHVCWFFLYSSSSSSFFLYFKIKYTPITHCIFQHQEPIINIIMNRSRTTKYSSSFFNCVTIEKGIGYIINIKTTTTTNSVAVVMFMLENIISDQSWFVIEHAIDQAIDKFIIYQKKKRKVHTMPSRSFRERHRQWSGIFSGLTNFSGIKLFNNTHSFLVTCLCMVCVSSLKESSNVRTIIIFCTWDKFQYNQYKNALSLACAPDTPEYKCKCKFFFFFFVLSLSIYCWQQCVQCPLNSE